MRKSTQCKQKNAYYNKVLRSDEFAVAKRPTSSTNERTADLKLVSCYSLHRLVCMILKKTQKGRRQGKQRRMNKT